MKISIDSSAKYYEKQECLEKKFMKDIEIFQKKRNTKSQNQI